jgi:hypothetical protein
MWIAGVHWAYILVFKGAQGIDFHTVGICFTICGSMVLSWVAYNRVLYMKQPCRKSALYIPHKDIAAYFGVVDSETRLKLTGEKCLNLHLRCWTACGCNAPHRSLQNSLRATKMSLPG